MTFSDFVFLLSKVSRDLTGKRNTLSLCVADISVVWKMEMGVCGCLAMFSVTVWGFFHEYRLGEELSVGGDWKSTWRVKGDSNKAAAGDELGAYFTRIITN